MTPKNGAPIIIYLLAIDDPDSVVESRSRALRSMRSDFSCLLLLLTVHQSVALVEWPVDVVDTAVSFSITQ